MRRLTLTFALVCGFCAVIYAGPEPLPSGKEMKEVAPVPSPACFNWSGFYVGGFGGYKFSSVDLNLDLTGEWITDAPEARELAQTAGSRDLDNDGAEAGGLIGYNFQWNCWVFGLEADGGYLWARDSSDSGTIVSTDASDFHIRSGFKTHYLATVAPRIGYAFGRWLPYVTGGLALGDLDYEQEVDFLSGVQIVGERVGEGGHHTQTNAGWMVGGGLQYALTDHWSLRAQYQFIDLGDIDFDSNFPPVAETDAPSHHRAELREHNASFAIMYKF